METLFCRITSGVWMSRSSLVRGPFSVVCGLAIALVTVLLVLLYKDRDALIERVLVYDPEYVEICWKLPDDVLELLKK